MPDYAIVATGTRPYQHLLCQRPAAVEAALARALVIVGSAGACESRLSTDLDSGSGASTGGGSRHAVCIASAEPFPVLARCRILRRILPLTVRRESEDPGVRGARHNTAARKRLKKCHGCATLFVNCMLIYSYSQHF